MAEQYEYKGDIAAAVRHEDERVVLSFTRGGEVVTEIHLHRAGAKSLAGALLGRGLTVESRQ